MSHFIITDISTHKLIETCYEEFNKNYFTNLRFNDLNQFCHANFRTYQAGFKDANSCLRKQSNFNMFYDFVAKYFITDGAHMSNKHICKPVKFYTYLSSLTQPRGGNVTRLPNSTVLIVTRLRNFEIYKSTLYFKNEKLNSFSLVIFLSLANLLAQFAETFKEHKRDVVFALLGSEEAVLNNRSSVFLGNQIWNERFNEAIGIENINAEHLSNIIELDNIKVPTQTQDLLFNIYKPKIFSGDMIEQFCQHPIECRVKNDSNSNESSLRVFETILGNISGFTIQSDDYTTTDGSLIDNIYTSSSALVISLANSLFKSLNLPAKVNQTLIDKEYFSKTFNCFNSFNCNDLNKHWHINLTRNEPAAIKALVYALKQPAASCETINSFRINSSCYYNHVHKVNLHQQDNWMQINYLQVPKLSIFLKSKVQYVSGAVSLFFIPLTVVFIWHFKSVYSAI